MRQVRRVAYWTAVLLIAGAAYGLQRAGDAAEEEQKSSLRWEPHEGQTVRLASFGFEQVIADYYWVKSLLYVMEQFDREERDYSPLPKVYETITDLDARFGLAYHYGSVFAAGLASEPEKAILLLEKGLRSNNRDWRFRWLLNYDIGSMYSFHLGEREKALPYYKAAALDPNCPPGTTKFISRILSAGSADGNREMFELWKHRLDTASGPIMKQLAEEEMKRAQSNLYLEELRKGVALFEERFGNRPEGLEQLVSAELIKEVPEDPLGGTFSIDSDGEVMRLDKQKEGSDGGVLGREGR